MKFVSYIALAMGIVAAGSGRLLAIDFANIDVIENDAGNNASSVTVSTPAGQSTSGFFIFPGSNKGDYNVRIGASATDDAAGGILIASVRENGRTTGSPTGFATATIDVDGTGAYFIPLHNAPAGSEQNMHIAAMYFDFASGWLTGHARNSTNGGAITSLNATPGLTLGTNFIDDGGGLSRLYLPGVNTLTDGVLMINGGKNEDNYALSRPSTDGSHFQLAVHDNGSDASDYEQDPVAFAYVPLGTQNATLGRITGNGLATVSQGDFSIQDIGEGQYRLSITGQTPTSGTLIVTPEGMNNLNVDNIVSYQASGNTWVIQSRDLAGTGLQSPNDTEGAFNFVFLPFASPPTTPGNRPTFNPNSVGAATVNVTEFNAGNDAGDMYAAVSYGTAGMFVQTNNRGDNTMGFGSTPMTLAGGVLLGTISEHSRNNSATGGLTDYGTISLYGSGGNWVVSTTTSGSGAEHNIDYAVAYFPNATGFQTGAQTNSPGGTAAITLAGSGDTRTSGVLMANAYGNVDNFATVQPRSDGSGWTVQNRNTTAALEDTDINYAFLPYGTENLIAAQVTASGHLNSRVGDFTLTREGTGLYRLTLADGSPIDGMLLLNATHASNSSENTVAYRPEGNSFLIQGIDMQSGGNHAPQDTAFNFAYISYNDPLANPQLRSFDNALPVGSLLNVRENDTSNSGNAVSINTVGSEFFTISSTNRGDYNPNLNGLPLQLQDGILMATVRQHGTGATVSAVHNGITTETYLASNLISTNAETNQLLAATFFPFAGDFIGAHVDQDGNILGPNSNPIPGSSLSHSGNGLYQLLTPNIDSRSDGLLFAINGENNAAAITAAVLPGGNGWTIGRRGTGGALGDGDFSLLFLPISAADYANLELLATENLVGGRVAGDGSLLVEVGEFELVKGSTGEYLLTLVGGDTPLDGTLLLTASELRNGMPDDTLFSYEALGDSFLIQARDPSGNLRDAQFAFAFNSFANPLAMSASELVVPEPTSVAAWCLLGFVALAIARRRQLRRTSVARQK